MRPARCLDRYQVKIGDETRELLCSRRRDHAGEHSSGSSIHWPRRSSPSPGRAEPRPEPR
jgi:hypothetical protein